MSMLGWLDLSEACASHPRLDRDTSAWAGGLEGTKNLWLSRIFMDIQGAAKW